jgi:riboflavin kinase/FMN adenylyltransferase
MQHITSLRDADLSKPSVVTIGAFDGVHRGHQYLVAQLCQHAGAAGHVPVVLTFHPHPELILRGFRPGFYLTLPQDRARLLGELGVELVVTHPFDDEVRLVRAAEFVDRLLKHLKMASLWIGPDFALGYRREGDVAFLREQGRAKGFDLRVVDLMDAGGERVSSSRVRAALRAGDVAEAARLLGRPYRLPGRVVAGAKRGRAIGFPTANLSLRPEQATPSRGVYAGWASLDGRRLPAVINIGMRPTFDGTTDLTVEAHLLDFSADIYDREIALYFVDRLRDELKFDGVEALYTQIQQDIARARRILHDAAPEAGGESWGVS